MEGSMSNMPRKYENARPGPCIWRNEAFPVFSMCGTSNKLADMEKHAQQCNRQCRKVWFGGFDET